MQRKPSIKCSNSCWHGLFMGYFSSATKQAPVNVSHSVYSTHSRLYALAMVGRPITMYNGCLATENYHCCTATRRCQGRIKLLADRTATQYDRFFRQKSVHKEFGP